MASYESLYKKYTNEFESPFNYSTSGFGSKARDFATTIRANERAQWEQEQLRIKGRSGLDRTFDFLMTPLYASAGFVDGLIVDKSLGSALSQSAKGALHGLNVFNNVADETHEYTYGKILGDMGWQPETGVGKFAKGTVGLALDILLDPTTYLTGGLSSVVKGTGRTGVASNALRTVSDNMPTLVAENSAVKLEKLIAQGVNPDLAQRLITKQNNELLQKVTGKTEMTEEMASVIIQNRAIKKGQTVSPQVLADDSKRLAQQYNKALGIRDAGGVAKPITFGVENMPFFGQKLAPKMGIFGRTVTLGDGKYVRKASDALGISRAYAGLRSKIYGGKIGELFSSTNAPLFKMSKENPEKLYNFMVAMDKLDGKNLTKYAKEKSIRDTVKAMELDLSPAEQKQVIKLLEDKKTFQKIKTTLKYSQTQNAKLLKQELEHSIQVNKQAINDIQKKYTDTIAELSTKLDITEVGKIEAVQDLKAIQNEMDMALNELSEIYASGAKVEDTLLKDLIASIKDIDERIASYVPRGEHFLPNLDEMMAKLADEAQAQEGFAKQMEDYKALANKQTNTEEMALKNETSELSDVDGEVVKAIREEQSAMLREKPTREAKIALADSLSVFAYGVKGRISYISSNDAIMRLAQVAKERYNPADVRWYLESRPNLFSSHAGMVWSHIAGKYGYKSWEKKFTEPMKALRKKLDETGQLTPTEQEYWSQLLLLRDMREMDFKRLHDSMTEKEFMQYLKEYENTKMYNEVFGEAYEIGGDAERRRRTFTDNDRAKAGYKDPDVDAEAIDKMYGDVPRPPTNEELAKLERAQNFVTGRVSVTKPIPNVQASDNIMDMLEGRTTNSGASIGKNGVNDFAVYQPAVEGAPKSVAKPFFTGSKEEIDLRLARAVMDDFIDRHIAYQTKLINQGKKGNIKWKLGDDITSEHSNYVNAIVEKMHQIKDDLFDDIDIADLNPTQLEHLIGTARSVLSHHANPLSKASKAQQAIVNKLAQTRAIKAKEEKTARVIRTVNVDYRIRWRDNANANPDAPLIKGQVTNISTRNGETVYYVRKEDGTLEIVPANEVVTYTKPNYDKPFGHLNADTSFLKQLVDERAELVKKLELAKTTVDETKEGVEGYIKAQNEYIDELYTRISKHEELIKDYERKMEVFEDTLDAVKAGKPVDEITELERKIKEAEKALDSDDALETYARLKYGDKDVNDIIAKAEWDESDKIMLDVLAPNERVHKWTSYLFEEFKKMGAEEVAIKRLKKDQFNAMLGRYFPHILSKEGQEYIAKNSIKEGGKTTHVTDKLGFGQEFNQFSMSRTTDGMTVEEINAKFSSLLKGKNLLSESLADVYLARALKNNELMYDYEYMQTMMKSFGEPYVRGAKLEKGKKVIANYGLLREEVERRAYTLAKNVQANPTKEQIYHARNEVLVKLGLPENILDDIAVPMVELTSKQADNLEFSTAVMVMDEFIVNKVNQARKLQIAKDNSRFLQFYDKFLHLIKLNQTVVSPAFQLRNKQSNLFQMWLAVGKDAGNWRNHVNAWKTASAKGDITKLQNLEPIVVPLPNGGAKVMHWHEMYELAKQQNVIDEGFFAKELGAESATSGLIKKLPRKYDPTDTSNFILYQKMSDFGIKIDNGDRLILFASALKQGKSVREASDMSKQFLFDYSDLTHFEKNVMRRVFPYYTWLRKNGRLQVSQIIEQPGKYQTTAKIMEAVNSSNSSEDSVQDIFMADFAKDWIQLPFTSTHVDVNGNVREEPILLSPNMPFMDLGRLPNPLNFTSAQGAKDELFNLLSQTAPLIKNPLELASNTNFFFDSEIAKEGEGLTPRLEHIARQLALYNIGEGLVAKEGIDRGLHMVNNATGVKMLSYDYDTQKNMRTAKYYENEEYKPTQLESLMSDLEQAIKEGNTELVELITHQLKMNRYETDIDYDKLFERFNK